MKTLDSSSSVLLLATVIMAQVFSWENAEALILYSSGYLNSTQSTKFGWLVGLGLQKSR